ncbi:MAG: glycine cleavage system protein GcvH, partial [Planctomycetales bacterium]
MDPAQLQYAKTDEWVHLAGEVATIGISDFAVQALTDLVYIELPKPGTRVEIAKPFGVVESVKAASDMYSPVTGEVLQANQQLENDLGALSADPFGAGWLLKVRIDANGVS